MQVMVNGKPMEIAADSTLGDLIKELHLDLATVVTELNGRIVAKEQYETRTLEPGDRLELVRLVGGG